MNKVAEVDRLERVMNYVEGSSSWWYVGIDDIFAS